MLSAAGDPDAAGHVAGAVGEDHRQHDGARLWPGLRARARQGGDYNSDNNNYNTMITGKITATI